MSDQNFEAKPATLGSDPMLDAENPMKRAMRGREQAAPPLPAEHELGRSHSSYHLDTAQPEMEPLDWRRYLTPRDPGKDYQVYDLDPGRIPEPGNMHVDRLQSAERTSDWSAYAGQSHSVDAQQRAIALDYQAFMDAQHSGDLQALGFVLPSASWKGDVATLADQQVMSPGITMGGLFRSNGAVDVTSSDQPAINRAGQSVLARGAAKPAHDKTVGADHNLLSKYQSFKTASDEVLQARDDVARAQEKIEIVELHHLVEEDREALEEAREHAEGIHASLEFLVGGLVKYTVLEAHEFGDLVESVGAMASYAVGRVSGKSIEAAKTKLKADTAKLHSAEAAAAAHDLEAAKAKARTAVTKLKTAREDVLVAMQQRQSAYDEAGKASAMASGGSASTRRRISGSMSAIPSVELVVGLARSLADKAARVANYTEAAGTGFHMAVYDQKVQATHFVSALDQIEYVRSHFSTIAEEWGRRLGNLQTMQTRLGGVRPVALDTPAPAETTSQGEP